MGKRALIIGLITLALTATSVFFGKSYARDIYTYDCEIAEQRPSQITRFCADGGASVYDITWETWGYNGATGRGFTLKRSVNLIVPKEHVQKFQSMYTYRVLR